MQSSAKAMDSKSKMFDFGWMLANTYGILILPSLASILFLQLITPSLTPSILFNPITRFCYLASAYLFIPIHEGSHYLMCKLFNHKIRKAVFVQKTQNGISGYIEHTYDPKSIYQEIGNFFIGCAPLFCVASVAACANWFNPWLLSNALALNLNILDIAVLSVLGLMSIHCTPSFSDLKHTLNGAISISIVTSIIILALDISSPPALWITTAKLMIVIFVFGYLNLITLFILSKLLKFPH